MQPASKPPRAQPTLHILDGVAARIPLHAGRLLGRIADDPAGDGLGCT